VHQRLDRIVVRPERREMGLIEVDQDHIGALTDLQRADLVAQPDGARGPYRRHPQRDALAKALADLGIGTAVHYPAPVPGQPLFGLDGGRWPQACRAAAEVLSLPCFAELTDGEVEQVAHAVRAACDRL